MPNLDNQTIQLAIVAFVAFALVMQAAVLLAIFFTVRKTANSIREDIEDLRSSVMPIVFNTRELITRVAPRLEAAADDLAEITHGLRVKSADVEASATEIMGRLRHQAARMDAMVSTVLDTVDRVGTFVTDTVGKPVRQLSALLASAKAAIESLRASQPEPAQTRSSEEEDRFI